MVPGKAIVRPDDDYCDVSMAAEARAARAAASRRSIRMGSVVGEGVATGADFLPSGGEATRSCS